MRRVRQRDRGGGGGCSGLFAVLQLSDSAFPAGLFTQSAGLETAVAEGWVAGEAALRAWVDDLLTLTLGPLDGRAAARCWHAAGRGDLAAVLEADRRLEAMRVCREPREGSVRSGRSMLAVAAALDPTAAGRPGAAAGGGERHASAAAAKVLRAFAAAESLGETPGHHAAALGVVGRAWGAPLQPLLTGLLFAAAAGAVGAAVRLGVADHVSAQRVLTGIRGRTARSVARTVEGGAWWSFAPAAEIAAMRHEAARIRLFAT